MSFYKSIAKYYEYIFPLSQVQVDFINQLAGHQVCEILDIGCGTGSLALALQRDNRRVTGIDLDETMVDRAMERATESGRPVKFKALSMLELEGAFETGEFDYCICFGNTLVHLATPEDITTFFKQARSVLKPGGQLLLQIVNYDRILNQKLSGLPTLDNELITFSRNYQFHEDRPHIDFKTVLTIKSSGHRIENSIPLLPLSQAQMLMLLAQAGFVNIKTFGSFKKEPFTMDSPAFVVQSTSGMMPGE